MSEVIRSDIYSVISDSNIQWDKLENSTVLVTGATGLVGGALVRALSAADENHGLNMRLIANGRSKSKGDALVQELGLEFVGGDIRRSSATVDIADKIDYILHCAAITKSADMVARPLDVVTTAVDGTRNMLELAREKSCKSFVYVSSMEVYGQTEKYEVCEKDLGHLDLSSLRSSYPESKRFCEMLCAVYKEQYELPVKIARLAQTFGAGMPKDDTRVFAQFARSAIAGTDIELHTEGKSRGNYCYISDAVRGLLTVLLKGRDGEAYNISNPDASATIREMAEMVASDICDSKIKVVVKIPADIEKRGYAPDVRFVLNSDKLQSLAWVPKYGLNEIYERTLADWRSSI